jgi:hypothetical protein
MDPSADFKSANLPNLRRLTIAHSAADGSVGQLYDSILPQLDRLCIGSLCTTDIERLLPLSAPLLSLRTTFREYNDGLSKVLDQLRRMDLKRLLLFHQIERGISDDWETDFEWVQKFKKVAEGNGALNRVVLVFIFSYTQRPSVDVRDRALARWKGIKRELESIFVKKGIEVGSLSCRLCHSWVEIWAA